MARASSRKTSAMYAGKEARARWSKLKLSESRATQKEREREREREREGERERERVRTAAFGIKESNIACNRLAAMCCLGLPCRNWACPVLRHPCALPDLAQFSRAVHWVWRSSPGCRRSLIKKPLGFCRDLVVSRIQNPGVLSQDPTLLKGTSTGQWNETCCLSQRLPGFPSCCLKSGAVGEQSQDTRRKMKSTAGLRTENPPSW